MAEAAPKKKRKLVDSDEEEENAKVTFFKNESERKDGAGEEENTQDELGKTVDIDFSLFDFRKIDYHAVKRQLTNYPDKLLPMHQVADCIVDAVEVGATLRAFEKIVGFCTIINLSLNREAEWLKVLSKFLTKRDARWPSFFEKKLGLLIHFRMINLPQSLGVPVQESLQRDLDWVQTKECTHLKPEQKASYKFDHIAVLCKRRRTVIDEPVYDEGEVTKEEIASGSVPPANKKRKTVEFEFMFAEDKIYQKYADVDITFGSEATCSTPGSDIFHVLIIPITKWKSAVEEISSSELDETT